MLNASKDERFGPFVAGIIDDPENAVRRLVFADFLEECGDEGRAALVRGQTELWRRRVKRGSESQEDWESSLRNSDTLSHMTQEGRLAVPTDLEYYRTQMRDDGVVHVEFGPDYGNDPFREGVVAFDRGFVSRVEFRLTTLRRVLASLCKAGEPLDLATLLAFDCRPYRMADVRLGEVAEPGAIGRLVSDEYWVLPNNPQLEADLRYEPHTWGNREKFDSEEAALAAFTASELTRAKTGGYAARHEDAVAAALEGLEGEAGEAGFTLKTLQKEVLGRDYIEAEDYDFEGLREAAQSMTRRGVLELVGNRYRLSWRVTADD